MLPTMSIRKSFSLLALVATLLAVLLALALFNVSQDQKRLLDVTDARYQSYC
jgi:hypothetical protein